MSRLERMLDKLAVNKTELDGTFNTVVPSGNLLWRISKGNKINNRTKYIKTWIREHDLSKILGDIDIAPRVLESFSEGSWLTDERKRIAMKFHKYTGDLHLFFSNYPSSPTLGNQLIEKFKKLGSMRIIHCDIKFENILFQYKNKKVENFVASVQHSRGRSVSIFLVRSLQLSIKCV